MQFGIFSVSDITRDPTTDYTPSEAERIDATVKIAQKTEEVGMDVFAIGEHHNPPFFSSAPSTLLAYIAATTKRLVVTTSTTLITTNDPVRIAEEYAMLQHLSKGRMDLMLGRGRRPWWTGRASSAARCRASPRSRARLTTCRRSSGTAPSGPRRSPSRPL